MYQSVNADVRRWNSAMALIAGFCGVVALGSIVTLAAPSTLYAPTVTTVRPVATAAFQHSGAHRDASVLNVAEIPAVEQFQASEGFVQVPTANNAFPNVLAMLGMTSIIAGAALLLKQFTQKDISMAATISKKKVPVKLEEGPMPMNTYGPKSPYIGTVKSVERIVGPKATGETCNIVIETSGKIPFWEGQSYGVIPPGTKINSKGKEVPHGTRLYSIASSRYGDFFDGNTTTLCVRRATYWDPELGREDPAKKGICSNFLCDAKPGTKVTMTGPTGKILLLDNDPCGAHICVATGTGIAPFRSFWRRMFYEDIPNYKFNGIFWLFMGVANSDALLYDNEIQDMAQTYPKNFRVDYALSREQNNTRGGKMYIQDKVEEYADQVFGLLSNGAHIYFCGLKGMMPGIQDMLERVAKEKGLNWEEYFNKLKSNNQWHVEVY